MHRASTLCRLVTILLRQEKEKIIETGAGADRRCHPRLCAPFPAIIRGKDASGEPFEVNAALDNISAGGLYVRLERCVKRGMKLFVIVRLSNTTVGWGLRMRPGALSARHAVRAWRRVVRQATRGWGAVVQPSTSLVGTTPAPLIAIRGVVIRAEPQLNGMCGVAVAFTRHRFL